MFMEKIMKEMKLHTHMEHRGYAQVSDHVSGCFSRNMLANSLDNGEGACHCNQGIEVQMSRL